MEAPDGLLSCIGVSGRNTAVSIRFKIPPVNSFVTNCPKTGGNKQDFFEAYFILFVCNIELSSKVY